jgi:hypothetical protein
MTAVDAGVVEPLLGETLRIPALIGTSSQVKMGRRPARCYRYCKNKP